MTDIDFPWGEEGPTPQQLLDFVVGKLREQGRPSVTENGELCLYRGPNGTRCSGGWVLPDECVFEELTLSQMKRDGHPLPAWLEDEELFCLLSSLQYAHDNAAEIHPTPAGWLAAFEHRARAAAEFCRLTYPEAPR